MRAVSSGVAWVICTDRSRPRSARCRSASPSVHAEIPSSATSLIRNWPVEDSIGKPPSAASNTPGVVNRKLSVATNSPTAITLPTADTLGHHGPTASSTAAATSTDTEQRRERGDREQVVQPAHQGAGGDQRLDALGLVGGELHQPDPADHDDEAVPGQEAADAVRFRATTGASVLGDGHDASLRRIDVVRRRGVPCRRRPLRCRLVAQHAVQELVDQRRPERRLRVVRRPGVPALDVLVVAAPGGRPPPARRSSSWHGRGGRGRRGSTSSSAARDTSRSAEMFW